MCRVQADLEDPKSSILSGCPEEGPINVVILSLTGRASPHLHNGVLHVGDENTYVSKFPLFLFSKAWSFTFPCKCQGCAAMGCPCEEWSRLSGARGWRTTVQATGLPFENSEFADLGYSLPWSSRCSIQHQPRITSKLSCWTTVHTIHSPLFEKFVI